MDINIGLVELKSNFVYKKIDKKIIYYYNYNNTQI